MTAKSSHGNILSRRCKGKDRNPVVEALLTNYVITGTQNQLRLENEQLSLFGTSDTLPEKIAN